MAIESNPLLGLTACQIRMAAAALRWSVPRLAEETGVSEKTLRRIMGVYGVPDVKLSTLTRIHDAFARQGIVFLSDDRTSDGGPGLRYGRYPGRKTEAG